MRVLICGAGIAGLSTAVCLGRWGYQPVIVERAPALRGEGYMMDFFGPGYEAAEQMRLLGELQRIHYPIARLVFADAAGRARVVLGYRQVRRRLFADRHFNFMRGDLECVLHDRLDASVDLRFGTTVAMLTQGPSNVMVTFSDGSSAPFDVIIGADGVHSTIRALAFGPEQRFVRPLGYLATSYIVNSSTFAMHVANRLWMQSAPGRNAVAYPIRGDRAAVCFVERAEAALGPREAMGSCNALRGAFSGMGGLVPAMLDGCGGAGWYRDDVIQIELPKWSAGRIALVGDAAWCVSPLAGVGASLAMAGAFVLAEELARTPGDVIGALGRYEARLVRHIRQRQAAGRRTARWLLPDTNWGLFLRDRATRAAVWPGVSALVRREVEPTTHWIRQ